MKKLLFQSDDYGISDAVSDGIIKGIKEGIIRNTGLFVNMPSSKRAAEMIRDIKGINVGIDINLVAGRPVTDPKLIPHLVDETGHFISSTRRMKEGNVLRHDGLKVIFEEDPYVYEETLLETENQVKRFIELMGRKPDYFHGHSLMTDNTLKASFEISKKYDILNTINVMTSKNIKMVPCDWTPKPFLITEQMCTDVTDKFLNSLKSVLNHEIGYFICHCGYVDADLLKETTYTLIRTRDLECALSDEVKEFLKENEIELITYDDLKEVL